jgi:hypothetical protein
MSTTTQGPYTAGDLVRTATWWINPTTGLLVDGFRDQNGAAADPSTVTLKYRTPDGATHTLSGPPSALPAGLVRSPTTQGVSLGLFQADLDTTALPGQWSGQWMAPQGDPVQSIQPWSWTVNPAPVP